jgi:uncharacterized protein (DUF433 family)
MGGMPCIRSLRIPVATVVGMIADGMSEVEILEAYPDLESSDIHEALRYAAELQLNRPCERTARGILKDELFITGDFIAPIDVEWDALK